MTKRIFLIYLYVQISVGQFEKLQNRELSLEALHKVRVEDLPDEGLDVHFSDPKEEWNRYFHEIPALGFNIGEALEAAIKLQAFGNAIQIKGWLHTVLELQCCRCLEDFACPLNSQIDVTLFPEKSVVQEEEVELETEDLKTGFFTGDEVDLSGLIREQTILAVPYKALCQEECRGLCPQCGKNLNEGDCTCERKAPPSAFEALKNLKLTGK